MKKITIAAALLVSVLSLNARAQDLLASAVQVVVDNTPPVHVRARIVEIDTASRTLVLQGPRGNAALVAVRPDVQGYDQLKVGDTVDVLYKNALLLTAYKQSDDNSGIRERIDTQTYAPGGTGYDATHRIDVIATVQNIDLKRRLVTLRGAVQTQTLIAGPNIDLSALKKGDTVHAAFQSATAVKITPGNLPTQQ